ncbi:MAG TPA: phosphate ABC transporter permease subunit PstC [Clostridia bacterium]|nr:phosphate ABC transporter permease subunit PstC [Clostridia bacterium]
MDLRRKIRKEYLGRAVVTLFGFFIILLTLSIGAFLFYKGMATFTVHKHSILEFLFSSKWSPAQIGQGGSVGAAIFIFGSITISLLALLIATPFSLAAALFLTEISPHLGRKLLQPAVEIFVGIPSVVYGWVGLTVLVPAIAKLFHLPYGYSVLAGAIVLAVMIFPTITSVSSDAIRNVAEEYKEASYGLGSTRWQLIRHVIVPAALPGILTGVVLGLARAFGEALAVAMVIGKMQAFPGNILKPTVNLTSEITADMGNTISGSEWNDALWTMALFLLVISFIFIVLIRIVGRMGENKK